MTTTNHHRKAGPELVLDLGEARERRARSLLERRTQLGTRWAEALSHGMPDAEDLAHEIAVAERAIFHTFPALFHEYFAEWVVADASKLHVQGEGGGICGVCDVPRDNPHVA